MNTRLFYDLEQSIEQWMNDHCEGGDWLDVYVGNLTVNKMASAAAAVLDGIEEAQQYERANA